MSAVPGTAGEAILSSMLLTESHPSHLPPGEPIGAVAPELARRGLALLEEVEATI